VASATSPHGSRFVNFQLSVAHRLLRDAGLVPRMLMRHNVGYHIGRTRLWKLVPRLCFTGDALFAVAAKPESPAR